MFSNKLEEPLVSIQTRLDFIIVQRWRENDNA